MSRASGSSWDEGLKERLFLISTLVKFLYAKLLRQLNLYLIFLYYSKKKKVNKFTVQRPKRLVLPFQNNAQGSRILAPPDTFSLSQLNIAKLFRPRPQSTATTIAPPTMALPIRRPFITHLSLSSSPLASSITQRCFSAAVPRWSAEIQRKKSFNPQLRSASKEKSAKTQQKALQAAAMAKRKQSNVDIGLLPSAFSFLDLPSPSLPPNTLPHYTIL